MSDAATETNAAGDSPAAADVESMLTIRIPNPKTFMARQSLWIGRRGKPRCDNCRINNLKCDRVLPACNHCSWIAGKECKYTPLPTPAHRGVPRCDQCRESNLKCDRSVPICNQCGAVDRKDCHYTQKRGHWAQSHNGQHTFEKKSHDVTKHEDYDISTDRLRQDPTASSFNRQQESAVDFVPNISSSSGQHSFSSTPYPQNQLSFIAHTFRAGRGVVIPSSNIEAWTHTSFAPLPGSIVMGLKCLNASEFPDRKTYELSLQGFVDSLMNELKETASLSLDLYSNIASCLSRGNTSRLSPTLRSWISRHHLSSGSMRYRLIIMPRDSTIRLDESEQDALRQKFCISVDSTDQNRGDAENASKYFDRLPVQNQVYDILSYAHRSHSTAVEMLHEVSLCGFAFITWPMAEIYVRMCPQCNAQ